MTEIEKAGRLAIRLVLGVVVALHCLECSAGWSPNPLRPVAVATGPGDQTHPRAVADGAGGFIMAWADNFGATSGTATVRRYGADASLIWEVEAISSPDRVALEHLKLVRNAEGELFVVASDGERLLAQKLTSSGQPLWASEGVVVDTADNWFPQVYAFPGPEGGLALAYSNHDSWSDDDGEISSRTWLEATFLNAFGVKTASRLVDNTTDTWDEYENPEWTAASDGRGGLLFAWLAEEYEPQNPRVPVLHFARMNSAGEHLWGADSGTVVSRGIWRHSLRCIASRDGSLFYLAWIDDPASPADDIRVFAQQFDQAGLPLWGTSGRAVSSRAGIHRHPAVTVAGSDLIVGWNDESQWGRNYVQRFAHDGRRQWGIDANAQLGVQLNPDAYWTGAVQLTWDDTHGLFTLWTDGRPARRPFTYGVEQMDLVAQKVSPTGDLLWGPGGRPVTSLPDDDGGQLVSDGMGGCYLAWAGNVSENPAEPTGRNVDAFASHIPAHGSFFAARQTQRVLSSGGWYQQLSWNFETEGTELSDATYESGPTASFWFPAGQWLGTYVYDYLAGGFVAAGYRIRE